MSAPSRQPGAIVTAAFLILATLAVAITGVVVISLAASLLGGVR
jgi:hypothetical protein